MSIKILDSVNQLKNANIKKISPNTTSLKNKSIDNFLNSTSMYEFNILNTIMSKPNSTIQDIIEITKMPPATVYRIIVSLKQRKIIYKTSDKSHNNLISTKYTRIQYTVTKNGTVLSIS